jgi:hypothetical protein
VEFPCLPNNLPLTNSALSGIMNDVWFTFILPFVFSFVNCRTWQQLKMSERDGSLRFEWVLSEHQVKMLEGLSMLPVKLQVSLLIIIN